MDWEGAFSVAANLPINGIGTHYIVDPSTVKDEYTDPTLTRTRLNMLIRNTGGLRAHGAYGVIAWPDKNNTPPGALEAPDPFLNPHLDWVMHAYYSIADGTNLYYPGGTEVGALESSAQRRLGNMFGILFVISSASFSQDTVEYTTGARCLLKDS
jgi:hypothetical protein